MIEGTVIHHHRQRRSRQARTAGLFAGLAVGGYLLGAISGAAVPSAQADLGDAETAAVVSITAGADESFGSGNGSDGGGTGTGTGIDGSGTDSTNGRTAGPRRPDAAPTGERTLPRRPDWITTPGAPR